jgi:hypothetical protein
MTKRPRDPIDRARLKLAQAHLELHLAQERRNQAIAQGEREIRDAQSRALERERKATERVERRAGNVARAEARLYTLNEKVRRVQMEEARRHHQQAEPIPSGTASPDGEDRS